MSWMVKSAVDVCLPLYCSVWTRINNYFYICLRRSICESGVFLMQVAIGVQAHHHILCLGDRLVLIIATHNNINIA